MITPDDVRFLLRRPITFYRVLADIAGSAGGGLFLSQLLYWSDKGDDPDGWIYKTQEQWTEETCLTRSEQERARKALREVGVLEEVKRGVPARLFYRLNAGALARMLNSASKDASSGKQLARMHDPASKDAESRNHSPITETTTETTQRLPRSSNNDPVRHDVESAKVDRSVPNGSKELTTETDEQFARHHSNSRSVPKAQAAQLVARHTRDGKLDRDRFMAALPKG